MYRVLLVGVACAVSTPAIAQTTTPASTPSAIAPAPQTQGTSQGGLRTADSATFAVRFASVKPADVMSTKLVGTDVYNNQNENLGEIEDLVIEGGRTITGVVVSVGGFLGLGESYVVIDPSTVVLSQKDGSWKAFVDTSKDNLKSAPKFHYSKTK
jgi:sporulation protein YlmC with PRC-barrel domain